MSYCACAHPKPIRVTIEWFPMSPGNMPTEVYEQCDRCGRMIEPDNGPLVPDELPDDDGQLDFTANDEGVIE